MAAEPHNGHKEIPIEPEGLILSPIQEDQHFQSPPKPTKPNPISDS